MKKLTSGLLAAAVATSLLSTAVMAKDYADMSKTERLKKAQKLLLKKLKGTCKGAIKSYTGGKLALQHTVEEWEEFKEDGKTAEVIIDICKKGTAGKGALKEKYIPFYEDFFIEYGKGGAVPSC